MKRMKREGSPPDDRLSRRLKKYSTLAATAAAMPMAHPAQAVVLETEVESNAPILHPFFPEEDEIFLSMIQVDVDNQLARPGVPLDEDQVLSGVDVALLTKSGPKANDVVAGFGKVVVKNELGPGLVQVASKEEIFPNEPNGDAEPSAFAARFADALSALAFDPDLDLDSGDFKSDPKKEPKALLYAEAEQQKSQGAVLEQFGLFPPTGDAADRGFLSFVYPTNPLTPAGLEVRVNANDGILDRTITVFGVSAVPAPTTWSLMALGVAGLAGLRRRQRAKASAPDA